jgi:hypothetical protein
MESMNALNWTKNPKPLWLLSAAAMIASVQIALFWPGLVEPDALAVYKHARTGIFDDWHPPILGRTWQVFLALGLVGTAPFFILQSALFWLGLGSIAHALAASGKAGAGWCVLGVGLIPHVLGWNMLVLKDTQMTCCLIAAAGLWAHYLIRGLRLPYAAIAAIVLLLAYAILVRHNTIFAALPLAAGMAFDGGRGWRRQVPLALAVSACLALFAASGFINQRVFAAHHAYAENSLKLFDMAGTAHFARLPTIDGIAPADWKRAEARNCYWSALWDSYNTPVSDGGCPWIYDRLWSADLTGPWLRTIRDHPLAYARHRLAHYNQSLRFWTSRYNYDAAAPSESDNPNPERIGQGNKTIYRVLMRTQMLFDYTPLSRPFAWYLLGLALFAISFAQQPSGARTVSRALLLSAGLNGASLFVISVAGEFRYHHWSLVAIGCAACLVYSAPFPRKRITTVVLGLGITILFAGVFVGYLVRHDEYAPIAASTWIDPPEPVASPPH